MKHTLRVGQKGLFSDTENNLVKVTVKKIHIGEGNEVIGCDAITSDGESIELSTDLSVGGIYYEIPLSEIKIKMQIATLDNTGDSFIKGTVTKISLGEENRIVACEMTVPDDISWVLSDLSDSEEDKLYALYTTSQESITDNNTPTTIITKSTKSVGIAIMLTLLFGPLGLFYASVAGGIIMTLTPIVLLALMFGGAVAGDVSLVVTAFISYLTGALVYWLVCIIWAIVAVNEYNSELSEN